MKEKPIIFSTPMVKAILEGRKTQTRRVMKPQPELKDGFWRWAGAGWSDGIRKVTPIPCHSMYNRMPYQPDDILWVRETWCYGKDTHAIMFDPEPIPGDILYKADFPELDKEIVKWRPSIHMPKEAARLFLRVKNVRVERVQDITEEDAKAEGVIPFPYDPEGDCWNDGKYKTAFEYLWNTLHGWNPNAWGRNDWVWVIEFERIQESEVEKG